jgi:hypothetical protein
MHDNYSNTYILTCYPYSQPKLLHLFVVLRNQ